MIKEIIKDRDLILDVKEYDVILIASNILCTMGCGFQHKIGVNFPDVKIANLMTRYGDIRKLGTVQACVVDNIVFCLCYISKGNFGTKRYVDSIDYDSLKNCLSLVNHNFQGKRVACTMMGCDIFECCGERDKVFELLSNELKDCDVYVYDYKQESYRKEEQDEWDRIKEVLNTEGYLKFQEEKIKFLWKRTFGIYTEMPKNKSYSQIKDIINIEKKKRKERIENIVK